MTTNDQLYKQINILSTIMLGKSGKSTVTPEALNAIQVGADLLTNRLAEIEPGAIDNRHAKDIAGYISNALESTALI